MSRKTREQKIIANLRRKLATSPPSGIDQEVNFRPRQEAVFTETKLSPDRFPKKENFDSTVFSYDPKLIAKDLTKTFLLSLIVFGLEFVLYWKLR